MNAFARALYALRLVVGGALIGAWVAVWLALCALSALPAIARLARAVLSLRS